MPARIVRIVRKKKTAKKKRQKGKTIDRTAGPFANFSLRGLTLEELQSEYDRIVREFEEGGVEDVTKSADVRYAMASLSAEDNAFNVTGKGGTLPSRWPYTHGAKLGRGCPFAPKFREFVESGGLSRHKSAVVVNIRYLHANFELMPANGGMLIFPGMWCLGVQAERPSGHQYFSWRGDV